MGRAANPVSWGLSSMRDGVRTARVTATHTVCRELGVHKSRAVGSDLEPAVAVCRNLDPMVSGKLVSNDRDFVLDDAL